jgi:hypothetical protein
MDCISPMSVPRPAGRGAFDRITVPCGVCMACLSKKRAQWAFRLSNELKNSETAFFVTLTYDDKNKPKNDSLCKIDCTLFLKRLRERHQSLMEKYANYVKSPEMAQMLPKIRFFLCGEYGTLSGRPHYHMLLFNVFSSIDVLRLLEESWKKGHVHVGSVTPKSINYTVKYCINEIVSMKDRENTFILMSRRPGIGISYVEKMAGYHQSLQIFHGVEKGNVKVSLPRYYRDKIFNDYENRKNKIKTDAIRDAVAYKGGIEELEKKRQYTEKIKKNSKINTKL